jgi:hypothetical protein
VKDGYKRGTNNKIDQSLTVMKILSTLFVLVLIKTTNQNNMYMLSGYKLIDTENISLLSEP